MPVPNNRIDYLKKPWIDHRNAMIEMLCATHGSCYRDVKLYRGLQS